MGNSIFVPDVPASKVESVLYEATFPSAFTKLRDEKYEVISLAQAAALRIVYGQNAKIINFGHYVREGFIYCPGERTMLTRISPILSSPEEVEAVHSESKEFYPSSDLLEELLKDAIEIPNENISTKRFSINPFTLWAFGGHDAAKEYGDFLHEMGVSSFLVSFLSNQYVSKNKKDGNYGKPFVRQAFFEGVTRGSKVIGDLYSTHIQMWRGIKQVF